MSKWKLSPKQAAYLLGVPTSTVYTWISRGDLVKVGDWLRLDDVLDYWEELQEWQRLLDARDVAAMLGLCRATVLKHANLGNLRARKRTQFYRFELEDVIAFWREHMGAVCIRCGWLGEGEPDLGFLCRACEYEKRTGGIYHWPRSCKRSASGLLMGRLVLPTR